jgi:hypothetical protein
MGLFVAVFDFDLVKTDLLSNLSCCFYLCCCGGDSISKGLDFHRFHSENISRIHDDVIVNRAMRTDTIGYQEFLTEQHETLGATWQPYSCGQ